jgi:uncharacterized cofD-like protein
MLQFGMDNPKNPLHLVTIGGGKGQGTILSGLKKYTYRLALSAIVSMVDNGGSTGRLREELKIPSFGGDFRDVMTSLSLNQTMVDLFQHRYEYGSDIKGHSVGNLILLGLLEQSDWDMPRAIDIARDILDIKHTNIYPSTLDQVHLVAEYEDGTVVKGQDQIDNDLSKKFQTIKLVHTEPDGAAYGPAVEAIKQADALVLCPGDLYGSLLCNLVIPGIKQAIAESNAKIIYVTNLMTKVNQTHGWKSSQFIDEVQRYLPRKLDYAIVNTGELDSSISGQEQYAQESWEMVANDLSETEHKGTKVITDKIWFEGQEFKRVSTDVIPRSFIRHDPAKIAEIIMGLVTE